MQSSFFPITSLQGSVEKHEIEKEETDLWAQAEFRR